MRFKLTQVDADTRKYHLDGHCGFKRDALEPPVRDANEFAETHRDAEPPPVVLIRNERLPTRTAFGSIRFFDEVGGSF